MRARSYRLKIGRPPAEGFVTVRDFGREPEPMLFSHRTTARALLLLLAIGVFPGTARAASVPPVTAFPVVGTVSYIDDFGAPRPQGPHEGNDVMSVRHQPAIAFEAGRVQKWHSSGRTGTCMLYLHGRSGMTYVYIHLNNDLGAGNDNNGGCRNGVSWAPGLKSGQWVKRGQLVGFVGDSGDANGLQPHLHFEVRRPGGAAIDPYRFLKRSVKLLYPRPAAVGDGIDLVLAGATVVQKTSNTITVRTKRILQSRPDLAYGFARKVTMAVPSGATIRRKSDSGSLTAAGLASARVGEKVRLRTATFTPDWNTQRARASAISVNLLVLYGS
jgi:hypothetical protein